MNSDELSEFILGDKDLAPHQSYLDSIKKPSVDIHISDDEPEESGSRFAGVPLLPEGFEWPVHEIGEYRFIGQINFSEIQDPPALLPREGLFSLFYAYDEDGEVFSEDEGYILGYYLPDIKELSLFTDYKTNIQSRKILLETSVDIPRHEELREDWPFDTDILSQLREPDGISDHYMLGYPSYCTLGYDPTPGDDWISLITLSSCDELEWWWNDGDRLMVFIEKSKLINKDFRNLKADAG